MSGGVELVRADITRLDVDAVVNAANAALRGGGGVDGAIHAAAGPGLLDELRRRYPDGCRPGDAVLTAGHGLRARFVIHAVGPVWSGGAHGEPAVLRRAYDEAFARAREAGGEAWGGVPVRSIAFPSISTGVYGYPKHAAARVALGAMREHAPAFERVVACVFDAGTESAYREAAAALGVALAEPRASGRAGGA